MKGPLSLVSWTAAFSVTVEAFPTFLRHRSPMLTRSFSTPRFARMDSYDDDFFDVEAMRQRLERLVVGEGVQEEVDSRGNTLSSTSFAVSPSVDYVLPPPPPLTAIQRERRAAEMEHLSHLADGDDILQDLWTLWSGERGPQAEAVLFKVDELMFQGGSSCWPESERLLRDLIDEFGVHWTEPLVRLSTLYFLESRLEESLTMCQLVLAVKPWHVGALSLIVNVYAAMNDVDNARMWAARRLPSFAPTGANRRRKQWVERAVADAIESYGRAERQARRTFGKQDEHVLRRLRGEDLYDEDAWQ